MTYKSVSLSLDTFRLKAIFIPSGDRPRIPMPVAELRSMRAVRVHHVDLLNVFLAMNERDLPTDVVRRGMNNDHDRCEDRGDSS